MESTAVLSTCLVVWHQAPSDHLQRRPDAAEELSAYLAAIALRRSDMDQGAIYDMYNHSMRSA
jgi:hypothetical protein